MGRDGLSTITGPIGGDNYTALGASETNTIQSLLQMKDTYEFLYHTGDIGSVSFLSSQSLDCKLDSPNVLFSYADYFLKESVQGYFGTADNETMPTVDEVAEGCAYAFRFLICMGSVIGTDRLRYHRRKSFGAVLRPDGSHHG